MYMYIQKSVACHILVCTTTDSICIFIAKVEKLTHIFHDASQMLSSASSLPAMVKVTAKSDQFVANLRQTIQLVEVMQAKGIGNLSQWKQRYLLARHMAYIYLARVNCYKYITYKIPRLNMSVMMCPNFYHRLLDLNMKATRFRADVDKKKALIVNNRAPLLLQKAAFVSEYLRDAKVRICVPLKSSTNSDLRFKTHGPGAPWMPITWPTQVQKTFAEDVMFSEAFACVAQFLSFFELGYVLHYINSQLQSHIGLYMLYCTDHRIVYNVNFNTRFLVLTVNRSS